LTLLFTTLEFKDSHPCVSWYGYSFSDSNEFAKFLQTEVRERLDDEVEKSEIQEHLNNLNLTGMGREHLQYVLSAQIPDQRNWVAGEALAEAFLIKARGVAFPWNAERDKRNVFASLPGPDLIGFIKKGNDCYFAFGEVKTSSEQASPPQVMSGRSGYMGYQIEILAADVTTFCQLLKWLYQRVKNSSHKEAFQRSCTNYFNSGGKSVVLFGVLIRDTLPNERDLSVRGKALRRKFTAPTKCNLVALYVPWNMDQLIPSIRKGGSS